MKFERLGNIAEIVTGKYDVNHSTEDGEYIFYTCAMEQFKSPTFSFEGEAILLPGNGANVGQVFYNDGQKFEAYQRTYVILNIKAHTRYVYYVFKSFWKNSLKNAQYGSATNYIRLNNLTDFNIPLPSLTQQIHIANILTKAESLIQQRKQSIALLDAFLKSTFWEMFGNYEKMSNSKIEQLGDNISFLTSGSRGWAKHYSDKGAKFLRIQNIGNGQIRTDNLIYVNTPNSTEAERTRVQEGDLIISITADLGRTSVVPKNFGEAYINQHLALVRLNKNINPMYAAYFYNLPFGNNGIQRKNRAAVKAGLNFNDIKSFPIIIPPIELQNQFAHIVEKTETLKQQYQQSLQQLEQLFGSLSQQAFKGELVKKEYIEQEETISMAAEDLVEYIKNK